MEEQVGGVGAGGPGPTHLFGMGGVAWSIYFSAENKGIIK